MVSDYEYWLMCKMAYKDHALNSSEYKELKDRWYLLHFFNFDDGLQCYAIKHKINSYIVIAFRGTDEGKDWISNALLTRVTCPQYYSAKQVIYGIHKKYPTNSILLCGHSLGGAIAQYLILKLKLNVIKESVTFNSAGIYFNSLLKSSPQHKMTNYVVKRDFVGNLTGFHTGNIVLVEPKYKSARSLFIKYHLINQFKFNEQGKIIINKHYFYNRAINKKERIL